MSKGLEALNKIKKLLEDKYGLLIYVDDLDTIETELKRLKALEIISNISKQTTHFRLVERQNFEENKTTSYYLIIGCGASKCEYKLKDKEEYDLLKEVLR